MNHRFTEIPLQRLPLRIRIILRNYLKFISKYSKNQIKINRIIINEKK